MDTYAMFVVMHIAGTILGVAGVTFGEIILIRALRDGNISFHEEELIRSASHILQLALFIMVLSGFGFLLYPQLAGVKELLYSPTLWAKLTVVGMLILNAIFLQLRWFSPMFARAVALTSWYTALTLGVFRGIHYSYFGVLLVYILTVIAVFFMLRVINKKFALLQKT